MRASWTRDEVILGLDVLFSHGSKHLSMNSDVIIELSELLNRLPIIPNLDRDNTFRNTAGVSSQLSRFLWSLKHSEKHANIGKLFYDVYQEYKDRPKELHAIAQSIRRCEPSIHKTGFSAVEETENFPEGAILSHLHRYLERRHGVRFLKDAVQCVVCKIRPEHIYGSLLNLQFFEPHLLIPPTEISNDMTFVKKDFIAVCPNCHRILHQIRPWRNRKQCNDILHTFGQGKSNVRI